MIKKYTVLISVSNGSGIYFGVEGTKKRLYEIIESKKLKLMQLYYVNEKQLTVVVNEVDKFETHVIIEK